MKKTTQTLRTPILEGCSRIITEFNSGLAEITEQDHSIQSRAVVMGYHTRRWLLELRELINETPFGNTAEEIYVFKYVKPQLTGNLIYEQRMAQLLNNIPQGTMERKLSYFEDEQRFLRRELGRDAFYYEYYKLGLDELDNLAFVRAAEIPFPVLTEVEMPGYDFSTPLDYLFAKFRAFEDLLSLLEILITDLLRPIDIDSDLKADKNDGLRWTGDTINLVELAYAIWLTGQVNNGNANISEIIRWMEGNFQVKIGRAHRRWEEIVQRKRVSTTKYLDTCRDAIYKRLDDENSLK